MQNDWLTVILVWLFALISCSVGNMKGKMRSEDNQSNNFAAVDNSLSKQKLLGKLFFGGNS